MKGEVRNPTTVWLLAIVTCGVYPLYWWYTVGNELKDYLGDEELNPTTDILISIICGFYVLYLPIKYGALIQRAQQKAGIPGAEDQGVTFLLLMFLCSYGYAKMQEELNRAWESTGEPSVY